MSSAENSSNDHHRAWGGWIRELRGEFLATGSAFVMLFAAGGVGITLWEYIFTTPFASRTVYYDSSEEFPSQTGNPVLTHIQYEVENPGPGDLSDVKIVVRVKKEDVNLLKASPLFTGYVEYLESSNGSRHEFIATTTSTSPADLSPLGDGDRLGVRLSIQKPKWEPLAVMLRRGSSEEVPIEEAQRPAYDAPYWYPIFGAALLAVIAVLIPLRQMKVRRKWEGEAGVRIKQEAMEHTAEVLSRSDDISVSKDELLAVLKEHGQKVAGTES